MKFLILGIVMLIAGIALMDINFYLGLAVTGIGGLLMAWFQGEVLSAIINKVTKKDIEISNILDIQHEDKPIEKKEFLDAIQAIRTYVTQIARYSKQGNIDKIKIFDTKNITEGMKYKDNGQEHFIVLGAFAKEGNIDHLAHEKLFFLVNDINAINIISDSQKSMMQDYQFRIAYNAIFLEHYLYSLEQNVTHNTISDINKNSETIQKFNLEAYSYYLKSIKILSQLNQYFSDEIKAKHENFDEIPSLPVALGIVLDEEADLLNIYMTKEMGKQFRKWMASVQAGAMAKE